MAKRCLERSGRQWPYRDCRDKLFLDGVVGAELATRLGLQPGDHENRQCVILNAVAAAMWAKQGEPPSAQAVQQAALEARWEMWQQAAEAQASLGAVPSLIAPPEADLRIFSHDALMAHHDKDYRSLEAYPSASSPTWCSTSGWSTTGAGSRRKCSKGPAPQPTPRTPGS